LVGVNVAHGVCRRRLGWAYRLGVVESYWSGLDTDAGERIEGRKGEDAETAALYRGNGVRRLGDLRHLVRVLVGIVNRRTPCIVEDRDATAHRPDGPSCGISYPSLSLTLLL
jgi:hypothetical protein